MGIHRHFARALAFACTALLCAASLRAQSTVSSSVGSVTASHSISGNILTVTYTAVNSEPIFWSVYYVAHTSPQPPASYGPDWAYVATTQANLTSTLVHDFASAPYFSYSTVSQRYPGAPSPNNLGSIVTVSAPILQQNVTVNLAQDTQELGQPINGTATGAQGGNQYQFAVDSGAVNILGDPNTGAFVVTGNTIGPFQVRVWASAGNGYSISNDATASGIFINAKKHKVTVTLDNSKGDVARLFRVVQDGADVTSFLVPAGASWIRTVETPTTSPVSIVTDGRATDLGGVWTVGDPFDEVIATLEPSTVDPDENPPPSPVGTPSGPSSSPQKDSDKQVWSTVTAGNAEQGLTAKSYAEGVDKIIGELKKQNEDDGRESTEEQIEKARAKLDEETDGFNVQSFVDNLAATAQGTLDAIAGVASSDFEAAVPAVGSSSGVSSATGNPSSSWSLGVIDSGLPNGRWELKPFERFPWLRGMLLVIREVFLWGMCYYFYANVQAAVMRLQTQLNQVQQLDTVADGAISVMGNRIPGLPSVVALVKRLFVGVSIITAINLAFVALVGVMNSRINEVFGGTWTLANIGNIAQALAGKNEYFDHVAQLVSLTFPINAAIQLMVGWLVFCYAAMLVWQAAASVIKATKI